MNYTELFDRMHPGFFGEESICSLPRDWVFTELVMDLRGDLPNAAPSRSQKGITFGEYRGELAALRDAVRQVDEDWVQYFSEGSRYYCAFDGERIVAFCCLADMGRFQGLHIGGPGCVGTIPKYRGQGIGLEMVRLATEALQRDGFDLSWIHYTHLAHWYMKLGYQPVIQWNSGGFVSRPLQGNMKIISIAAVTAGGKTTIVNELKKRLRNSQSLHFDNYTFDGEVDDFYQWVLDGANYHVWNLSPLEDDILKNKSAGICDYLILDYPFAYCHDTIKPYIDTAFFIDTPLDIALARRILRDMSNATADEIRHDLEMYLKYARTAFIQMQKDILPSSDYVIDGTLSIDEIVNEIIAHMDLIQ